MRAWPCLGSSCADIPRLSVGSPSQGQKEVHYAGADGSQRSVVEDLASLSDRLMNVAFAGNPAQCIVKAHLLPLLGALTRAC